MITENLSTLKIHKLTQAQYERELAAGRIDENALYLTPDEEIDLSPYATKDELSTKADTDHNHNDVYYTETEIDERLLAKAESNHNHDGVYAPSGHTHSSATTSVNGFMSAEDKLQLDNGGIPIVTTSGTGSAYTATIDGITSLTIGMKVTIIPHVVSASATPTFNLNSLGAKYIRMPLSTNTSTCANLPSTTFLTKGKPVTLTWDGVQWETDVQRPTAQQLYGSVPIANGGTGATDAAGALTNLGLTATATELNYCDGVTSNIQVQLNELKTNIFNAVYPVGSIYMSVNPTDPSTYFGGTWVAWGNGRVPVGVDTSQSEFNSSEKTGGAKTHTLTTEQLPSHNHKLADKTLMQIDRNAGYALKEYTLDDPYVSGLGKLNAITNGIEGWSTYNTGAGSAHNNLQPYITCYMWKRTA